MKSKMAGAIIFTVSAVLLSLISQKGEKCDEN